MATEITLIRHAKPDERFITMSHHSQPLSREGKEQAAARRVALGNPRFDLVLTSHLKRAQDTAHIVASMSLRALVLKLPELFYREDDPAGIKVIEAFQTLGHSSLRVYNQTLREEIANVAEKARGAIMDMVTRLASENVLIIGHATLIPAIMVAITSVEEPFLDRVIGYCEGYKVILIDGRVTFAPIK